MKFVNSVPPAALIDDASAAFTELDTIGYNFLRVVVILGATDIGLTAVTLTESDTAGSGHANITGCIWGTSANIAGSTSTLPSATDDNGIFLFEVDLRGRKRYIDATVTVDDGTVGGYVTVLSILSEDDTAPTTAAGLGAAEVLRV